jgi:hypothetical protein
LARNAGNKLLATLSRPWTNWFWNVVSTLKRGEAFAWPNSSRFSIKEDSSFPAFEQQLRQDLRPLSTCSNVNPGSGSYFVLRISYSHDGHPWHASSTRRLLCPALGVAARPWR